MIRVLKVVGLNSDSACAQILHSQGRLGGELFVLLTTTGEDAFSKTRFALSEAESVFFSAVGEVSARLQEVVSSIKNNLKDLKNTQILTAYILPSESLERSLYLLAEMQTIRALLIRDLKITDLISAANNPLLVSGFLGPGDRLILTTQTLLDLLGDEKRLAAIPYEVFEEEVSSRFPPGEVAPLAVFLIEVEPEMARERGAPVELTRNARKLPINRRSILILIGVVLLLVIVVAVINYLRQVIYSPLGTTNGEQVVVQSTNRYEIAEDLPVWLDLNLVKQDFNALRLSLSIGKLLVLDINQGSLVEVNLASKSHKLLAGGDKLGRANLAALNGSFGFVYSVDKGIIRADSEGLEVKKVVSVDPEWIEINDLYGFGSNIYLLDKGAPSAGGQIWKYVPIESGYSDKIHYLQEGIIVDFSQAIRMQIDSSVWVLKRNGEIIKFTQGAKDSFSYSGLDVGIKEPKSFFVSDETDNLYLLDSGNSRLLVLTKSGQYLSQYLHPKLAEAKDLIVDESGKKVYLLDENQIYLLELR
ncbi:hypothetical protein A3B49_03710 [Candidatus Daviesbacteria bacterium RIFCSPLOWO2_01_FULL_40_24]|uniref:Uncharacterized protein n=1 Tax=Candidatus Daviesbacteria bacterium RIFCSPLOWO2_01_FULL_40_24 TaxID=1797787 RepID=A0A1F5MKJ4_9BACT|nr:MAG: hypothetical protein A3B49_03710 [Candidatus Daviesbacteria bacterium RIFCSPLOWO2_01_FULL_40_24]